MIKRPHILEGFGHVPLMTRRGEWILAFTNTSGAGLDLSRLYREVGKGEHGK